LAPLVEMRNITKRFPGVVANDRLHFSVEGSEVHALLGENGAGKTTLMNVLYGLYQPDEGEILVDGRPAHIHSPHDAIELGLGMVHQHFQLVPTFTVAENIVLGMPSRRGPFLDASRHTNRQIQKISDQYGLQVNPESYIWQLSVGEQQRVEILKALYRGARLLILDEPTAVLTPQEAERLFQILATLTDQGKSIILITHKLDEVMAASDRITVLRDGRLVDTVERANTTKSALARMMVGRDVLLKLEKPAVCAGAPALQLQGVSSDDDRGLPALRDISLELCNGEIFGIAGVDGNGQAELEEVVTGLRRVTDGQVLIAGEDITNKPARQFNDRGVTHVPSDRQRCGLVSDMTLAENSVLGEVEQAPFTRRGLLRSGAISSHCARLLAEYDVRAADISTQAGKLSGGNAQKLVLAREIERRPDVLVAAQPTRGLDIGATEYVRRKLVEQRDAGCAVLLISTELEEILSMSDRIAVLFEGRIVDIVDPTLVNMEQLGLMMAGVMPDKQPAATATEGDA